MMLPTVEPPQNAGDLRRLIESLEALATDPRKAPACRELLAKLSAQLPFAPAARSDRQPVA